MRQAWTWCRECQEAGVILAVVEHEDDACRCTGLCEGCAPADEQDDTPVVFPCISGAPGWKDRLQRLPA